MKKITDFIINKRYFILVLFGCLTIFCAILSNKVNINHDIAKYLPDTSETRIGMNIMEEEFDEISNLDIMFEDLNENEKKVIKEELLDIKGIDSVDYDNTDEYNKDNYTLYTITIKDKADSKLAEEVYKKIEDKYQDYTFYTSGSIAEANKTVLPFGIIVLAVVSALVILLVMCESYVEPFLFLISILMAVVLNKGTNVIFPSVSNITNSIVAILQMALSMDYSIMLMNRYDQEKQTEKDKVKAMKKALYKAFSAISSSSITTIVGLLALVFMSFKIGKDLGFILAKGVLFSLICIFLVLPALILIFDKWIVKTKKKSPKINLDKLGKFSYKIRYGAVFLFIIIFLTSFMLKGNLGIDYTDAQDSVVGQVFEENNQIAIIYKNEEEDKLKDYLKNLEDNKKVKEVLGYSNTINEKLAYNMLNSKLKDLDSSVEVEDYLLKILYYDYYNSNNDIKISMDDFINFIEKEVYNNDTASKKIDDQTKKDINRLKNFITTNEINKKRSKKEIASILEIDQKKIDDVFIYYLSKNNNIKLDMQEFVNFMNNDVLTDNKYASKIDKASKDKLKTLTKFVDVQTIQTKMNGKEMAELFDMDASLMEQLYQYYILKDYTNINLSINDFANFVLDYVINDKEYAKSFSKSDIENIKLLATFSNLNIINKSSTTAQLASLFNINEDMVKQLLLLKYINQNSESLLSIPEFIQKTVAIKDYLNGTDISKLENLVIFTNKENNLKEMTKDELTRLFGSIMDVDGIYNLNGKTDEKMTPKEFIDMALNTVKNNDNIALLKLIIDESISDNPVKYSAQELAEILEMPDAYVIKIYNLIDYASGPSCTPREFVNIILANKDLEEIKSNVDTSTMERLQLLSTIMTSANNKEEYSYRSLAKVIGMNSSEVKKIYVLYESIYDGVSITPIEFVDFVLLNQNDSLLVDKLDEEVLEDLNLLKTVMNDVVDDKKYETQELASLLNIDKEDLNLIYGLYDFKYGDKNYNISLKDFINFLLNNVVNNKEYASNFDNNQVIRLKTVKDIMDMAINKEGYTKDLMFNVTSKLSDKIDKNTIDMLYIYYGSVQLYDEKWEMTISSFVKFLNEDILNDEKFNDYIDEEMRNDIIDAKKTIGDAQDLLIGDNYSRIILNTTFLKEDEETFNFIKNIKNDLSKEVNDFYVIGDSPMAYEMSKTFNDELNLITIITMMAIFIVVAITFKSILIPIILVLIIQTAVYLTMGILSIVGENVYFISILIVQSILMGATIDYAIVYTTYYLEYRKTEEIKDAIKKAYNNSIHTILTSSLILIIVTLIIACFTSAIAAKICKTISEGTLCATILILGLLPAILACFDKFIVKKKNT